ncbi:hypothetical protein TNCV_891451 [Trichonephila clavipes]|nr:hypothetical protein TNCV_891451 [Trichonephila clavipes]
MVMDSSPRCQKLVEFEPMKIHRVEERMHVKSRETQKSLRWHDVEVQRWTRNNVGHEFVTMTTRPQRLQKDLAVVRVCVRMRVFANESV